MVHFFVASQVHLLVISLRIEDRVFLMALLK